MAQTGFTPVSLYNTSTASAVPVNTNLVNGELAINITDEKLYFKNAAGTVKLIASNLTPVANGGTGAATLASNNVLLGNGTSSVQVVAPGTSGNVLTSNGTTWLSSTPSGGSLVGTTSAAPSYKTALGVGAGASTTGIRGTFVGYNAGLANITGTQFTAVGYAALANATGGSSTSVGGFSGNSETTGSNNTNIGYYAGSNCTTGIYNVSIGDSASGNVTGSYNVAIGQASQGRLTASSSSYVVAVGPLALNNVSGDNNVGVGYQAARALSSGIGNTVVGYNAGYSGTNNLSTGSNNTIIGNASAASLNSVSNEITLGNSSIATLRCQVTSITSLSDARDKTDVEPLTSGVDFVNFLKPVSFTWNMRDGGKVGVADTGFLAQDLVVAQCVSGNIIPGLVYGVNPDRLEAAYGKLIPVLVKAIQELSAEVAALKAKI